MKFVFRFDAVLCGWLGSKHQMTDSFSLNLFGHTKGTGSACAANMAFLWMFGTLYKLKLITIIITIITNIMLSTSVAHSPGRSPLSFPGLGRRQDFLQKRERAKLYSDLIHLLWCPLVLIGEAPDFCIRGNPAAGWKLDMKNRL